MNDLIKHVNISKINLNTLYKTKDIVVREYYLNIYINDRKIVDLTCTPQNIYFLVIGYLLSEKLISEVQEIQKYNLLKNIGIAKIDLKNNKGLLNNYQKLPLDNEEIINNKESIRVEEIVCIMNKFQSRSELFLKTGGVHSVGISEKEKLIIFHEDISRHNALDKVIGEFFLSKIDNKIKIIILSCRITRKLLLKASILKIPVIITPSAPTDLAIEAAKELGITLIGFVRGEKMNIYAHEQRVVCE